VSEYAPAVNVIAGAIVGTLMYLWGYREGRKKD
jgi:hypothetical protein